MSQFTLNRLLVYPRRAAFRVLLCLFAAAPYAYSQAALTASRTLGVSAFAGAEGVRPEFNGSPHINGFLIGGDVTRYLRLVSPSLEVRFNDASGSLVSQKSFLVGLKAEHPFGRFHPYLNGLAGIGSINFNDPGDLEYTHDNSLVLDAGAGLDFDVTRSFQIKGDFQIQHWQLGKTQPVFTPQLASISLVYHPTFSRITR